MIDLIAALAAFLGSAFTLIAAIGLLRLPDVLTRMHGSTKVGTLGAGLIMIAAALALWDEVTTLRTVAIIAFLILTAPVAAHLIGRAAYRTGVPLWSGSVIDELGQRVERKPEPATDAEGGDQTTADSR